MRFKKMYYGRCTWWGTILQAGRWSEWDCFSIYLVLPDALGTGVHWASNRMSIRSRKRMFLRNRARPVLIADKLIAICEPIVQTIYDHHTTL
jgi:hypothetical protein